MAWRDESNELQGIWEQVMRALTAHGMDDLKAPLELLLNEAMKAERSAHLNAQPWQRTAARGGHANGFKPKTVTTRLGALDLRVPQVRAADFYPSALERGNRCERALLCALAEMYVQGVSTRKVSAIVEQLAGVEVTSMQVSRATAALDTELRRGALRSCQPVRICFWMRATKRYARVDACSTAPCCWPSVSPSKASVACWASASP